MLNNVPFVF